uniref:Japonicin-1 n=2 Tax=Rana japonica TaxID=8402 RepID=JAP1_RANJA|nr:RecName: Full=Japonicin-1 [Rana japonica]
FFPIGVFCKIFKTC